MILWRTNGNTLNVLSKCTSYMSREMCAKCLETIVLEVKGFETAYEPHGEKICFFAYA